MMNAVRHGFFDGDQRERSNRDEFDLLFFSNPPS